MTSRLSSCGRTDSHRPKVLETSRMTSAFQMKGRSYERMSLDGCLCLQHLDRSISSQDLEDPHRDLSIRKSSDLGKQKNPRKMSRRPRRDTRPRRLLDVFPPLPDRAGRARTLTIRDLCAHPLS